MSLKDATCDHGVLLTGACYECDKQSGIVSNAGTIPDSWKIPRADTPYFNDAAIPQSPIDQTLAERGARYGDFTFRAAVSQGLQDHMRDTIGWNGLSDVQKQSLTVISDKIARILTGDPNYKDNWHDIQGYAKLAEDRGHD